MGKIKVGVIGTGFIGPAHIEALRRLGRVEVAALAECSDEVAKAKAEMLNIEKYYGDYKQIIKDDDIGCIHICSPNYLHYEMAKAVLEAGKHVICEKPLAISVAEAEELVELADKKGLVNAVNFNIRYYPLMRQVRTMVDKGDVGDIFAVQGSYLQDWLFYQTDYNWRLETEQSGESRAIADIGSHWMDLIEYVTGLRIKEVCADFATFHKIRKKPLKPVETYAGKVLQPEDYEDMPINTEDYATVLFRFENDGRGVMTVNQVAAGRKNRLYFEMDGSKQSIAWESEKPNQIWIGRRDGNNEVMMRDPSLVYPETRTLIDYPGGHNEGFPDTFKQLFKEVYAHISGDRSGTASYPTFKDGLRELILCEKIMESNKNKVWIEVS
ncbi:MAG TPA: Gfo/Idh/MocA family oxidoreductase [Sedimentisphaerales bacterium]|nr:Gfo/Idh/MocA family oxidoreductase [Sedimentisphaerales bacterium]